MENMVNQTFWLNKKVLVTGHTGFKGSWLSVWLHNMGAKVYGFALEPDTNPSLFHQLQLQELVNHNIADIRNYGSVQKVIKNANPDVIIHMAAQPLVLRSYREPLYTWQTNVTGTINLLQAAKHIKKKCALLVVTTDKVYANQEWHYSYREIDRLGGHDPYSSSKAATEIAVNSWRESYFSNESKIRLASARAGNVIGGGDWAENRLVPDIVRALRKNEVIEIRNPTSVRPWQHVLEPLSGYLVLCEHLYQNDDKKYQSAFNFGPMPGNNQTVKELVQFALSMWEGEWKDISRGNQLHESGLLKVSIDKSYSTLNWKPNWGFQKSVELTIKWYQKHMNGIGPFELILEQINQYQQK